MEERMILVKVTHGFSRFYEKTRKENNTYLIHQFMIGNVELSLKENGWKNIKILFDCCRLCLFVVIGNAYFESERKLTVFRVFWCYDRKLDRDLTAGVFIPEEIRVVIFTMFCSNLLRRENLRWRFSHRKVLSSVMRIFSLQGSCWDLECFGVTSES